MPQQPRRLGGRRGGLPDAVGPAGIKVAVTGGTGAYAGSGGEITATFPAAGMTLFKFDLA